MSNEWHKIKKPASAYEAILIDPFAKSFSKVKIERGENELNNIYDLLGCRMIETVSPSFGHSGDRIIVDEEGLFLEEQKVFYVDGMILAGKGLYVGNKGSLFDSPEISVVQLSTQVSFTSEPFFCNDEDDKENV